MTVEHSYNIRCQCDLCLENQVQLAVASVTKKPEDLVNMLAERGKWYGAFDRHSEITQSLKTEMKKTEGWGKLTADQKEALEMVAHKIGRILNGDPNYDDSWVDIAGYAKLVADRLQKKQPKG